MVLLKEIKSEQTRSHNIRCLVLGLDNAGKSSVVAKLFNKSSRAVAPTVGFQISTMRLNRFTIDFWDVGGQQTLRPFWSNYYHAADALIWVVDSTDQARLGDCLRELNSVLGEGRLKGAELLILANKQDVKGALSVSVIREILNFDQMERDRACMIESCSAVENDAPFFQSLIVERFLNMTRKRLHSRTCEFNFEDSKIEEKPTLIAIDWNKPAPFEGIDSGFTFDTRRRLFPQDVVTTQ